MKELLMAFESPSAKWRQDAGAATTQGPSGGGAPAAAQQVPPTAAKLQKRSPRKPYAELIRSLQQDTASKKSLGGTAGASTSGSSSPSIRSSSNNNNNSSSSSSHAATSTSQPSSGLQQRGAQLPAPAAAPAARAAAAAARSGRPATAVPGSSPRRVKQYPPVTKGDLQLPGGPQWQALRRHVVAAGSDPALRTLADAIVVVEGDADQAVVARAVNVPVYICDGTRVVKEHTRPELEALAALGRRLIVLTDPDERGRELRRFLDQALGPMWHAFVAEGDATSAADGRVHAAGNRGVEHASAAAVAAALDGAARSYGAGRGVWTAERLAELRLASAFDDDGGGSGAAAERRRRLCARLGLGACSGAQLLAALNRYFSEEHVMRELQQLPE